MSSRRKKANKRHAENHEKTTTKIEAEKVAHLDSLVWDSVTSNPAPIAVGLTVGEGVGMTVGEGGSPMNWPPNGSFIRNAFVDYASGPDFNAAYVFEPAKPTNPKALDQGLPMPERMRRIRPQFLNHEDVNSRGAVRETEARQAAAVEGARAAFDRDILDSLRARGTPEVDNGTHVRNAIATNMTEALNAGPAGGHFHVLFNEAQARISHLNEKLAEQRTENRLLNSIIKDLWERDPEFLTACLTEEKDRVNPEDGIKKKLSLEEVFAVIEARKAKERLTALKAGVSKFLRVHSTMPPGYNDDDDARVREGE